MVGHPAKYSDTLLPVFRKTLLTTVGAGATVLDPFAGTGRIHELQPEFITTGIELEPEWAEMHHSTLVGNALDMDFDDGVFDAICTSPTYGNRMADHHEARDASKRLTYRHQLGRPLSPDNSGALQWGWKYREFHLEAWREALRVLKPNGIFILNCSNHIRSGQVIEVVEWHIEALESLGASLVSDRRVATPRMKFGANAKARIDHERVCVFRKNPNPTRKAETTT